MIKHISYFALFNILALIFIVTLAEGIFFLGTIGGAFWAALALLLKLKASQYTPSKPSFIFLVVILAAISATICAGFEIYYFQIINLSFFNLFISAFFISAIYIFLLLRLLYQDETDSWNSNYFKQSPVLKSGSKLYEKIYGNHISNLSDQELISAVTHLSPSIFALSYLICLLGCIAIWNILEDNPPNLLFNSALASAIIIFLIIWTVHRHKYNKELEKRFLDKNVLSDISD